MTTAITTQPISASAFLFGDNQDSVNALARALDEKGVVGSLGAALTNLSRAGRGAVGNQIATVAHGLLDLDLGDLVIGGLEHPEFRAHLVSCVQLRRVAAAVVRLPGLPASRGYVA
jgi:hypothetical protein